MRFDPRVGKLPWGRTRLRTTVFVPGESHGQRSLAGYSPQGRKESDTVEGTSHAHTCIGLCEDEKNRCLWSAYQSDGHRAPVLHMYS